MFSGWVFSRVLLNYRDILALNKLRSLIYISKFVRTGYKLELKTSVNLIIKTFPSYIRHHQVASVAIFSIFLFQFFFFYIFFFRTWKTWNSDCSDFLRSEKLKIGTNKTKSGHSYRCEIGSKVPRPFNVSLLLAVARDYYYIRSRFFFFFFFSFLMGFFRF